MRYDFFVSIQWHTNFQIFNKVWSITQTKIFWYSYFTSTKQKKTDHKKSQNETEKFGTDVIQVLV